MQKTQVSKKWKYECLNCSTQTKSVFTNGRKVKDAKMAEKKVYVVCGRCGSDELKAVSGKR